MTEGLEKRVVRKDGSILIEFVASAVLHSLFWFIAAAIALALGVGLSIGIDSIDLKHFTPKKEPSPQRLAANERGHILISVELPDDPVILTLEAPHFPPIDSEIGTIIAIYKGDQLMGLPDGFELDMPQGYSIVGIEYLLPDGMTKEFSADTSWAAFLEQTEEYNPEQLKSAKRRREARQELEKRAKETASRSTKSRIRNWSSWSIGTLVFFASLILMYRWRRRQKYEPTV